MVNNNKVTSFVNALNGLVDGKEDINNKVTSLSENSTNTQYPSAKTVYDELMTVREVTPSIDILGNDTLNNVTKNWCTSYINSSDLEYFERIIYNITFEDNDFQMFYQYPNMDVHSFDNIMIYFDGTDCYWGIPNNEGLAKGSLICEGNTIQATLNKDKTVTIGNTIVNWDIYGDILMFGDVDFTCTIYSYKYLDTNFPFIFEEDNFSKSSSGDYTVNSVTKDYGFMYLSIDERDNVIEKIYTITFNDDDFSYLDCGEGTIYFDGTDCYWGEWEEYDVLNKGTLICEGNVVQATYFSSNNGVIYFPDDNSILNMDNLNYFGDVSINVRSKALLLEYASNKIHYLTDSFNDSICYPSVAALKDVTSSINDNLNDKIAFSDLYFFYDSTTDELVLSLEPEYIIYDDSSSAGASNYQTRINFEGSGAFPTLSYDSTEGAYIITIQSTQTFGFPIKSMNNEDYFYWEADVKISTDMGVGFYANCGNRKYVVVGFHGGGENVFGWYYDSNSFSSFFNDLGGLDGSDYVHIKVTVQGNNISITCTDKNNTSKTRSGTLPTAYNGRSFGIGVGGNSTNISAYIKNIRAKYL